MRTVARFPVVGFSPEQGGISALHLGNREGRSLVYIGKVGTGFNRKRSAGVRRRLGAHVTQEVR